jgi:hypothetical protein
MLRYALRNRSGNFAMLIAIRRALERVTARPGGRRDQHVGALDQASQGIAD